MERRRKNKKPKKVLIVKSLPILFCVLVCALSIGFSAFEESLLIGETVTDIIPVVDIQITDLSTYSSYNNGSLSSLSYESNSITGEVSLPEEDSTATMLVEVTNLENAEAGILDIDVTSDNDKIDYIIEPGYEKKEKICDDNNTSKCTLGAKKSIYITLKNADNKYDANDTTDNFSLDFDFEGYYSITYVNITGSYQSEVMGGDSLEVDFGSNAPYDVSVSMDGLLTKDTDFTYVNGILNINRVTNNITVTGVNRTEGCYLVEALESDNTKGKIVAYDTGCGLNVTIPLEAHTSTVEGTFDMATCVASNSEKTCNRYKANWDDKQPGFMNVQQLGLVSNFGIYETDDTVTIQEIGDYAFVGNGITSLDLSLANGLTTIGDGAFATNHLTSLTLSQNITTIGGAAFQRNDITTLNLSNATSLSVINDATFSYNLIDNISFSNSITTIGQSSFQYNKLTSVSMPDSVTFIGNSAFTRNNITDVYIGSGIQQIDTSAFSSIITGSDDYHGITSGPNNISSVIINAHELDATLASSAFEGFNGSICWLKDDSSCGN